MTGIMTTSRFPEITDELLSAYIDNAVTTGERLLIEQAASEDATVAWRLATLQETVSLLRSLPVLNAPRAFALTPEMVGQRRVEPAVTTGAVAHNDAFAQRQSARVPAPQPGWWERLVDSWQEFWTEGSPVWRNALTTSMAALLVLLMLPALLNGNTSRDFAVTPMASQESAAAPASAVVTANEAAPASEAVAEMARHARRDCDRRDCDRRDCDRRDCDRRYGQTGCSRRRRQQQRRRGSGCPGAGNGGKRC
jgi:anti-sigma factor RsiW